MFEINPVKNRIQDLTERSDVLRGIFDYDAKKERLEVNAELEQPDVWNEPERAQALGKERSSLEAIVDTLDQMSQGLEDVSGLLELAVEADDEETFNEAVAELDTLEEKLAQLEFRRMFSGEYDSADCYLDIQAGSGGTEAQDWASMLSVCICAGQKRAALRPKSSKSPKVKWRVLNPLPSRFRRLRLWLAAYRNRRSPPGA
jgi:peptide chain release factor 2